jgi:phosphatidylserine/phosphatidylglycerophosphate/cardiolipin synthase-like enzyme
VKNINLNKYSPQNDGNYPDEGMRDNSTRIQCADVSIIFRNQKQRLLQKISEYNCVVGCVAWLTDYDILNVLSKVDRVVILVQKEDFLRPDSGSGKDHKNALRSAYNKIKPHTGRFAWPGLMGKLSVHNDDTIQPIRCVGNHNAKKEPAFPRMHNKFLVFGKFLEYNESFAKGDSVTLVNHEVWTGSYNLTNNAANSLENVVLINNQEIAESYYNEFCQIFALSEPLDWESEWCAPDLRIGT